MYTKEEEESAEVLKEEAKEWWSNVKGGDAPEDWLVGYVAAASRYRGVSSCPATLPFDAYKIGLDMLRVAGVENAIKALDLVNGVQESGEAKH